MKIVREVGCSRKVLRYILGTWYYQQRIICSASSIIKIVLVVTAVLWYFIFRYQISALSSSFITTPRRFVLGIQANRYHMQTLVNASQHTWIPQLAYDVYYFIGSSNETEDNFSNNENTIFLSVDDDEYPPINRTFAVWSYFYEKQILNYDYFILVDSDTYVNVEHFDFMLQQLTCRDCYIGFPAIGERYERGHLGLRAPYCLGMGYVISRHTLLKFGPHIETCQKSIVAPHSDTELGRCIYQYADGLPCTRATPPFERVLYTVNDSNDIVRVKLNARKQMVIDFPKSPPTKFFSAAMVHPLKKPHFFYQFHRQVTLALRPILPLVSTKHSCVANPVIQQELYPQKNYVPECPSPTVKQSINLSSLHAFVITLPGHDQRVTHLQNAFRQHGVQVERFDGNSGFTVSNSTKLNRGAWGLRLTMIQFFQMALTKQFEQVLVLEDDAIPHRYFGARFRDLTNNTRCGGYMQNGQGGGVLMLGATIWRRGWPTLDKWTNNETGLCRNTNTNTFGSFAAIFHRTTFEPILTWLNTTHNVPYDFIFSYLAYLGYPVRLAMPNLVIMDVTHMSLITHQNDSSFHDPSNRARIHRWILSDYMFTQYPYSDNVSNASQIVN